MSKKEQNNVTEFKPTQICPGLESDVQDTPQVTPAQNLICRLEEIQAQTNAGIDALGHVIEQQHTLLNFIVARSTKEELDEFRNFITEVTEQNENFRCQHSDMLMQTTNLTSVIESLKSDIDLSNAVAEIFSLLKIFG